MKTLPENSVKIPKLTPMGRLQTAPTVVDE